MNYEIKLIVSLALLTFILFVVIFTKQARWKRTVKETAAHKLRVAEMNRQAWQRQHTYALATNIEFQQLLGAEIAALMNWFSAHEGTRHPMFEKRGQQLTESLALFAPSVEK